MKSTRRLSEPFRALALGLVLGFFGLSSIYALPPVDQSPRDTADRLSRIDTNRAADLQIIKAPPNPVVRQAIQKQIIEDFRALQSVNNKMMADAWKNPSLDYKYISGMVSEIARKADRLKSNLALPESDNPNDAEAPQTEIATEKDYKAELLLLDSSVMRFVMNPIFQKINVVDVKLANQASEDLEKILNLTKRLKKAGLRLNKIAKD